VDEVAPGSWIWLGVETRAVALALAPPIVREFRMEAALSVLASSRVPLVTANEPLKVLAVDPPRVSEELPATVKVWFTVLLPVAPREPLSATGALAVKVVLFESVAGPLKTREPSPVTVGFPSRTRVFVKV
jgi:hypothetical protein